MFLAKLNKNIIKLWIAMNHALKIWQNVKERKQLLTFLGEEESCVSGCMHYNNCWPSISRQMLFMLLHCAYIMENQTFSYYTERWSSSIHPQRYFWHRGKNHCLAAVVLQPPEEDKSPHQSEFFNEQYLVRGIRFQLAVAAVEQHHLIAVAARQGWIFVKWL